MVGLWTLESNSEYHTRRSEYSDEEKQRKRLKYMLFILENGRVKVKNEIIKIIEFFTSPKVHPLIGYKLLQFKEFLRVLSSRNDELGYISKLKLKEL